MMRLSELVSNLTPTTFTVIALVLFLAVFVGVVLRAFWPGSGAEHARHLRLPLEGDDRE